MKVAGRNPFSKCPWRHPALTPVSALVLLQSGLLCEFVCERHQERGEGGDTERLKIIPALRTCISVLMWLNELSDGALKHWPQICHALEDLNPSRLYTLTHAVSGSMWEHIHTGSRAYAQIIPAIFVGIKCQKARQVEIQGQVRTHVASHRGSMKDKLTMKGCVLAVTSNILKLEPHFFPLQCPIPPRFSSQ